MGARLRAEAATVIDAVVNDGRSLDWALARSDTHVNLADRPMFRMLCYGCLRRHWHLRAELDARLERPLKKRDRIIESLMTVGIFQLSETRVPDHAAVSATVEAARVLRRPKLAGLVNAVLRNFLRSKSSSEVRRSEEAEHNHPQWLIDRIRQDWSGSWQEILAANNERAPMWLRVNSNYGTATEFKAGNAIKGSTLAGLPQALRLDSPQAVDELPGFLAGQVSVQDAAAQLAAPWLLAEGGQRVLDTCAAPGGKTGHLLELLPENADLTAIDSDAERLAGVRENLTRLNLHATVLAADASNPGEWWDGTQYDRILVDAPCSATGVIRRHPDIKLLRRETDVGALADLQRRILESLWPLLKRGGRLLYVTCSVLAAENDGVVGPFLAAHEDVEEDRVLHDYNIRDLMTEKAPGFQVLPGTYGLDGFYFACLNKVS
ncbi:MAG: 16S rRNA (cytosine(967)-C(5))-methyltransferase RsmB [Woeseiaceae bacterium]